MSISTTPVAIISSVGTALGSARWTVSKRTELLILLFPAVLLALLTAWPRRQSLHATPNGAPPRLEGSRAARH